MQLLSNLQRFGWRSVIGVFSLIAVTVLSAFAYQSQPQSEAQSQAKEAEPAIPAEQFIGTWQAELKGRPYFLLQITSVSPKVVGSFGVAPGLNVGPNGEVDGIWSAATLSDAHPLIEPKLEGDRLTFSYISESDEHPDTLQVVLTGPDEATIRLIRTYDNQEQKFLSEEEIAKTMKPSHMKKADKIAPAVKKD